MRPIWNKFALAIALTGTLTGCHSNENDKEDSEVKAIYDTSGRPLDINFTNVNSESVDWGAASEKQYNSIGNLALNGSRSGCTATFLDVKGASEAPAYFITNGHCFPGISPKDFFLKKSLPNYKIRLNRFKGQSNDLELTIKLVNYATVTGTDVMIVEANTMSGTDANGEAVANQPVTFGALKALGYNPIAFANSAPAKDLAVELLQIPVGKGSTARLNEIYLRKATCKLGQVGLRIEEENGFGENRYKDPVARHFCSALGGSSGSPMLVGGASPSIIALHFTSSFMPGLIKAHAQRIESGIDGLILEQNPEGCLEEGQGLSCKWIKVNKCVSNVPCEIYSSGKYTLPTVNYAASIEGAKSCFANGIFDINATGCSLQQ